MGWIFGALIVVVGLTMIVSGTSGTAGQAWQIITGHGTSSSSSSSSAPAGGGFGALGGMSSGLPTALPVAYNYPHVGAA